MKNKLDKRLLSSTSPLIIFDFDGVLCNSLSLFIKVFNSLSTKYNFNSINEQNIEEYRNLQSEEFLELIGINSKIKLYFIVYQVRRLIYQRIEELYTFDGIKTVLSYLDDNNINTGVLTSNSKKNVCYFFNKYRLPEPKFIVSTFGLLDKYYYMKRLKKNYQEKMNNIYYICDESRDIISCKKSKMNCIAVTWGFNSEKILRKEEPNFIANSTNELQYILKSIIE